MKKPMPETNSEYVTLRRFGNERLNLKTTSVFSLNDKLVFKNQNLTNN